MEEHFAAVQRASNLIPPIAEQATFTQRIKQEPVTQTSADCEKKSDSKSVRTTSDTTRSSLAYHKSIKNIISEYPNIVLPPKVLKCNVNAEVWLDTVEIDRYREKQRALKIREKKLIEKKRKLERQRCIVAIPNSESAQKKEKSLLQSSLLTISLGNAAIRINGVIIKKVPANRTELSDTVSSLNTGKTSLVQKSGKKAAAVSEIRLHDLHLFSSSSYRETKTLHEESQLHRRNSSSAPTTSCFLETLRSNRSPVDGKTATSSLEKQRYSKSPEHTAKEKHTYNKNLNSQRKQRNAKVRKKRVESDDSECDDFWDEIIPAKKDRSRSTIHRPQKEDLTADCLSDVEHNKRIFTSSLELTPSTSANCHTPASDTTELLTRSGKSENIFVCNLCQLIFDTKKELAQHTKKHLKCKFCKQNVKNISDLHEHLQRTCFIAIEANPPDLKLTRIDEVASVVEKYREVFDEFKKTCSSDTLAVKRRQLAPSIESKNESMETRDIENYYSNTNPSKSQSVSTVVERDDCVMIISDDDDNVTGASESEFPGTGGVREVFWLETPMKACVEEITPNEKDPLRLNENQLTMESVSIVRPKINKVSYAKVPNILSRDKVIRTLFSKYAKLYNKDNLVDNSTDPYRPSNDDIHVENNVIVFKGLFHDLKHTKIPVYFKKQEQLCASFVPKRADPVLSKNFEWPRKMAIRLVHKKSRTGVDNVQVSGNRSTGVIANRQLLPKCDFPFTTTASSPQTDQDSYLLRLLTANSSAIKSKSDENIMSSIQTRINSVINYGSVSAPNQLLSPITGTYHHIVGANQNLLANRSIEPVFSNTINPNQTLQSTNNAFQVYNSTYNVNQVTNIMFNNTTSSTGQLIADQTFSQNQSSDSALPNVPSEHNTLVVPSTQYAIVNGADTSGDGILWLKDINQLTKT